MPTSKPLVLDRLRDFLFLACLPPRARSIGAYHDRILMMNIEREKDNKNDMRPSTAEAGKSFVLDILIFTLFLYS